MDLILWRHADAEIGEPDDARQLTPKGIKQANRMGAWLDKHLPNRCKVLVSPTSRTLLTAQTLPRKFKTHPGLAPDATARDLLQAAGWPDGHEPVLLVGHQPALGQLAALLIAGSEQSWTIRKGNVWWIAQRAREGKTETFLRAISAPDLVPPVVIADSLKPLRNAH